MKKVLLGMSGGVDSTVSAILLKEQGYEVIGITLLIKDEKKENIKMFEECIEICDKLSIAHLVYDVKDKFKEKVIDYFISSYENKETPNPCVICNKEIKFKLLYEKSKELGIDYISMGHYANVEYVDKYNSKVITKSNNIKKDQTYFLYNIDKEIIDKCIFPLAKFETKDEIRKIAKDNDLKVASKSDSQDICFINTNYIDFLNENNVKNLKGNFIDLKGNIIAKHKGITNYTVGQRKGLGISFENPKYVVKFKDNDVVIGEEKDIYTDIVNVRDVNFLVDEKYIKENIELNAKVRYSKTESKCYLYDISDNKLKVKFDNKQRAVTKGQAIVFYDDNILIGGGIID